MGDGDYEWGLLFAVLMAGLTPAFLCLEWVEHRRRKNKALSKEAREYIENSVGIMLAGSIPIYLALWKAELGVVAGAISLVAYFLIAAPLALAMRAHNLDELRKPTPAKGAGTEQTTQASARTLTRAEMFDGLQSIISDPGTSPELRAAATDRLAKLKKRWF